MPSALVIGATGLVGRALVRRLLEDPAWTRVRALARRATATRHERYDERLVEVTRPEAFADLLQGDVLFSCLGTTRGQAGSVEAQRAVDYGCQLEVARLAAGHGVPGYVLVSSSGADAASSFAYLRMKGELERDVRALGFASVQILRPGPLRGERERPRLGEQVAGAVLGALASIGLAGALRPISGDEVARAMIRVAGRPGTAIHQPGTLFALAGAAVAQV